MNFFSFDLKKFILGLIILALPLMSINMEQKNNDEQWLVQPFQLLASSVEEVFFAFSSGVKETTALYVNLIDIKKDSARLHLHNQELLTRLQSMEELSHENNRLRQLLDFKQSTKMELRAAQIIGRDLLTDHNTVTINKGEEDGLKAGMAVITTQGVLGYVYKTMRFSAHVMLVTDRYAVVDGVIQRTRSHAIVEGKSAGACVLKYVENAEDVKEGDLIVTGGLDNIFPKGFPIAVVESVERKTYSVSLKIDLRPVVDPYKVEEVFIVFNANNEDLNPVVTAAQPPTTTPATSGVTQ